MISMAQLASHRANATASGDDVSVGHSRGVHQERTSAQEKMYAIRDVASVRVLPHILDVADESTGERLRALYRRSGLTFAQISDAAGYSGKSSVQKYLDGTFEGHLSPSVARKLADGFAGSNVTHDDIWALTGLPMPNATPAPTARLERSVRDIPVYGTALGAPLDFDGVAVEQTELDQGEVINWFTRPEALRGRPEVYGVYIQGASMAPRFQEGEVAFVDGKRPPQVGDDVLVFIRSPEDDGERVTACLIKRLVRRTSTYVELEQFNPGHAFRIEADRVQKVHRVIPWAELLA